MLFEGCGKAREPFVVASHLGLGVDDNAWQPRDTRKR